MHVVLLLVHFVVSVGAYFPTEPDAYVKVGIQIYQALLTAPKHQC